MFYFWYVYFIYVYMCVCTHRYAYMCMCEICTVCMQEPTQVRSSEILELELDSPLQEQEGP